MKYLVTGATGLVGGHIARKILAEGGEVRALRRGNSNLSMLADVAHRIEWVEADILDVHGLRLAMEGIDYVVHAAAVVHFGGGKAQRLMGKVNIEGTQHVVNMAIEAGVKKLCYVSSVAAVGRRGDGEPIDEQCKWEDAEKPSFYGFTKYHGELEVWRGLAEGLDVVVVNPSMIFGTGDWSHSSLKLFKYAWEGKRFAPMGTMNYVDARDVAEACWRLVNSDISGERFILCGGHVRYRHFFEEASRRLGKHTKFIDFKPWMGAIAWRLSALLTFFLGVKPIVNKETIESSGSHAVFNGQKVTKAIDFQYRSFDEMMDWACGYFLERQQAK